MNTQTTRDNFYRLVSEAKALFDMSVEKDRDDWIECFGLLLFGDSGPFELRDEGDGDGVQYTELEGVSAQDFLDSNLDPIKEKIDQNLATRLGDDDDWQDMINNVSVIRTDNYTATRRQRIDRLPFSSIPISLIVHTLEFGTTDPMPDSYYFEVGGGESDGDGEH